MSGDTLRSGVTMEQPEPEPKPRTRGTRKQAGGPRVHRVDVYFPPADLERLRALALFRGHRRKIPNRRQYHGDVSGLIRAVLATQKTQGWDGVVARFRRVGWDMASLADQDEQAVRLEVRFNGLELEELERLATRSGMTRGHRGNVSAFLRALLRETCGL